jgi:hypothetical protein
LLADCPPHAPLLGQGRGHAGVSELLQQHAAIQIERGAHHLAPRGGAADRAFVEQEGRIQKRRHLDDPQQQPAPAREWQGDSQTEHQQQRGAQSAERGAIQHEIERGPLILDGGGVVLVDDGDEAWPEGDGGHVVLLLRVGFEGSITLPRRVGRTRLGGSG